MNTDQFRRAWEFIESGQAYVWLSFRLACKQPKNEAEIASLSREAEIYRLIRAEGGMKTSIPQFVRWNEVSHTLVVSRLPGIPFRHFFHETWRPQIAHEYPKMAKDVAAYIIEFDQMMRRPAFAQVRKTMYGPRNSDTRHFMKQLEARPEIQARAEWLRQLCHLQDNAATAFYGPEMIGQPDLAGNIMVRPFGVLDFGTLRKAAVERVMGAISCGFPDTDFSEELILAYEKERRLKLNRLALCESICAEVGARVVVYDKGGRPQFISEFIERGMKLVERLLPRDSAELRPVAARLEAG